MKSSDLDLIKTVIKKIDAEQPHIKLIVLDTINTIASDMQMFDMKRASMDIQLSSLNPFNCWNTLKINILQNNHEIWISLNV
jgi:hypothetical protein